AHRNPLVREALEEVEQRQVAFQHRLAEPLLLEVVLVVRVPDVGKVGVEHEEERTARRSHHPCRLSSAPSAGLRTDRNPRRAHALRSWWAAEPVAASRAARGAAPRAWTAPELPRGARTREAGACAPRAGSRRAPVAGVARRCGSRPAGSS